MNRKLRILAVLAMAALLLAAMAPFALASEPHDHKWDNGTWIKEPTCKDGGEGRKVYRCTVSGCSEERYEDTPKLEHDYGPWSTTKAADCENPGTKERTCSRYAICGKKETDSIPATGHNWGEWRPKPGEEAKCDAAGKEIRNCGNPGCPNPQQERDVSAYGHNYLWAETTKPTCTKAGERTGRCSRCNETKTEPISSYGGANQSQGHTFGAWREPTTGDGVAKENICKTKVRVCSECGRVETAKLDTPKHVVRTTSKGGKTYSWFEKTKPSMQGPGRAVQYCKYCGKVIKSKEIKFEGGRYDIPVTAFGPKAANVNSSLAGSNDRLIPVDFTNMDQQVFGLITNDAILVGEMHLSVMDDTVSVSYTMNDTETVVSQAVFFMFPDAASLTAADLTDMTKAHQFGETIPLNGQTFGVLVARLVVNYNAQNAANRPFNESGIYLDGVTNNATIMQEMTTNLMGN